LYTGDVPASSSGLKMNVGNGDQVFLRSSGDISYVGTCDATGSAFNSLSIESEGNVNLAVDSGPSPVKLIV
jgi:hypothetical protein